MKKEAIKVLGIFLLFIFSISNIVAHGDEEGERTAFDLTPISLQVLTITAVLILIIALFSIIFLKKISELQKRLAFWIIAIMAILATIFLLGATLYLNATSPTKGPIHWHADFTVTLCNEEVEIKDPKGITNRIGTSKVHEHNDMRIHIEGTPASLEEIELGEFFKSIGGYFDETIISIPSEEGIISVKDGELCNNLPSHSYLFVESQLGNERIWRLEPLMNEYMIAPYSNVPPGDRLKIVFTEKNPEQILNELQQEDKR